MQPIGASPPLAHSRGPFVGALAVVGIVLLLLLPAGIAWASSAPTRTPTADPARSAAVAPGPVHGYHFASVDLQRPGWSGTPAWLAYDHGTRAFYVAEAPSGVAVVPEGNLSSSSRTVAVGTSPFAVAYDPTQGRLFVTNTGSNNLSVISDTNNSTVGSVSVGASPYGVAFDNGTDTVFAANGGSDSVTVVNASSLGIVATVAVGSDPIGIAYDPVSNQVVVANSGSDNLTLLNASSDRVVANVPAGSSPYAVAVDTANGVTYVSNAGSANVTVLNATGTGVVTTIPVGPGLAGLAYDSRNGTVWLDEGPIGVVVINATTNRVVQWLDFDPQGAVYDPDQNLVCVTDAANSTFECLVPGTRWYPGVVNITFLESGLPNGTAWSVTFGGASADSTTSTIEFVAPTGYYTAYTVGPVSQYDASPSTGYYDGNAVANWNLTVNFTSDPGLYVLTFRETGLSPLSWGSWWGLNVSNATYTSWLPTVQLSVRNGSYPYVPLADGGFVSPPGVAVVHGSDTTVTVPYGPARYTIAFEEIELPVGLTWSMTFNGTRQSLTTDGGNDTLQFATEPSGTYAYGITRVPGWLVTNLALNGTMFVGGPLNISVYYAIAPLPPNATYRLTFQESGLPSGRDWGVVVGSDVETSITPDVNFTRQNGTYGFVVLGVAGYVASAPGLAVVNGGNTTVPVTFHVETYPVVFIEFGLPAGTNWSVTAANATSGFHVTASSTTNSITVFLPNGTYAISFGLPTGYAGNVSSTQITVTGRATTGTTLSVGPVAARSSSPIDPWEAAAVVAAIVAVAAIVGALVWRRRGPPMGPGAPHG